MDTTPKARTAGSHFRLMAEAPSKRGTQPERRPIFVCGLSHALAKRRCFRRCQVFLPPRRASLQGRRARKGSKQTAPWCKPALRASRCLPSFLSARAGAAKKVSSKGLAVAPAQAGTLWPVRPFPALGAKSTIPAPEVCSQTHQRLTLPAEAVSSTRAEEVKRQPGQEGPRAYLQLMEHPPSGTPAQCRKCGGTEGTYW